jgi:GDP-L-fucose synthase
MPCNLYGPGDNYDPDGSHVIPAIIRKVHHAKVRHEPSVPVWGTGTPRREFLFVDDLADGCIRLMELGYDGPFVNIGSGTDVTIRELVETVMDVVGYTGSIEFDTTKPDGTPRKLMDVSRMHALGWSATTSLRDGLRIAYDDFLARHM